MAKMDFDSYDIVCFTQDDDTNQSFIEAAARLGEIQAKSYPGDINQAVEYIKSTAHTKILCVDCSRRDLLISDVEKLMDFCPPDTKVIILGDKNDVSIFRDLMKLNISDYLVKPVTPDILTRSMSVSLRNGADTFSTKQKRSGKMILFLGTTGGVGTTTLATNTATVLANEVGKKVVLIDSDLQFGNVTNLLNLKTSHALHDALESPERIDDLFLEQSMGTYGERLRILSSEEPLHETIEIDQPQLAALDPLIELVMSKFHYIIVDLCRHHPAMWRYFNRHANTIFLVSGLSIKCLRDTLRIFNTLSEEKESKTHGLIVNHTHEKETIKVNRFEDLLGRKVTVEVSYSPMAIEAADLGIPLALKNPAYRADIDKVIEAITGISIHKNQAPFLTKIAKSLMGR